MKDGAGDVSFWETFLVSLENYALYNDWQEVLWILRPGKPLNHYQSTISLFANIAKKWIWQIIKSQRRDSVGTKNRHMILT